MAITRNSRSITFTGDGDLIAGKFYVTGAQFSGTGLTPGNRIRLAEGPGIVLSDHRIQAAQENVSFTIASQWVDGLNVSTLGATGTWQLTVRIR